MDRDRGHFSVDDLAVLARAWAPVWVFDPRRSRLHWANEPALALWRAPSLAELRLRDLSDMSAATRGRIEQALESARAGRQLVEDWTLYPAGQPVHLQARLSGFQMEDGGLALLCEAANLPDALPATLRGIEALSHTTLMIALYSADGALLMRNPAAERAFGPATAASGTPRSRIAQNFLEAADREALAEAMAAGADFSRVVKVRTLQGERWLGIEVRPALDPMTGAPAFLVNKRDVTELKEVQRHAAEQSAFLRTVLDAADDAFYVYDGDGNIVFSNRANRDLLEVKETELVGRNLREVMPHPVTDAWIEENRQLLDSQGRVERDETVPTRRGGRRTLRLRKQAYIGPGGKPLIIGTASDISDLALANERARAGERAKGQFLATMSHEIRTPMTGVIGLTELLLKTELTREQQSYAQTLAVSAKALLNILNDVLDYSKIDAGRMEFNLADVDLWEICRETQGLFTPVANEKAIPILLEIDPESPRYIRADPVRLRQILGNLVGNAVKFTDTGQVDVRIGGRPLGDEGEFTLRVQDSGIGMNAEQIAGLFQPFSSTGGPTGRQFGGTGLGLAITKALVDAMGGAIRVDSTPGAGSVFQVTFRCPLGQAPKLVPVEAPHGPALSARILVADDHPTLRMLIATMLRRAGHSVDLVSDGLEAVQAASRNDYDLLLLDMQMPEMDGMAATRAIRALAPPFSQVPIFAISADAMPQNRQPYLDAGLDGFLTKPIDWSQVDAAIQWASTRQRDWAPAAASAPAEAAEHAALLDVEMLDNYALLIGRRPLLSMLGRIATAIGQETPAICDELLAGRTDAFHRRARALKSVVINFGARRLVALLDRALADLPKDTGPRLARELSTAGAETMSAMRRYRSGDSEAA